jgi:hypothetical protein
MPAKQLDSRETEKRIKIIAMFAASAGFIALSLALGPYLMWTLLGVGAFVSFMVFPDETEKFLLAHQITIIPALIGGILTWGNPCGIVCGALAGYYINHYLNQGLETIENVKEAADPFLNPGNYIKQTLRNTFVGLQNIFSFDSEASDAPVRINLSEEVDPNVVFEECQAHGPSRSAPSQPPTEAVGEPLTEKDLEMCQTYLNQAKINEQRKKENAKPAASESVTKHWRAPAAAMIM